MSLRLKHIALAAALGVALAGCQSDKKAASTRHLQPIPSQTMSLMAEKGMTKQDPILVRIYKEDSELELWKRRKADGKYALLKKYEICRWSGNLGPKKKEGDKQAPEGFYQVAAGQMNPNSSYHLSFDLGFPNAFDRSLGRTGKHLMVHGDCLSAGCYAMTDPQIAELYAVAREAFAGGQKSFQVQAMPFRMTAENMARRRNDPNIAFWKNLKQGSDHFEVTKQEPRVASCGGRYVFDATAPGGQRFDPNAPCPQFQVEPAIALAVAGKQRNDEQRFAALVKENFQLAEAYVPQNGRLRRELGTPMRPASTMVAQAQPAAVPAAAAPAERSTALAMASPGGAVPMPVPSPYRSAQPAPAAGSSGGMFAWMRGSQAEAPARAAEPAATPAAPATATAAATTTPQRTPTEPQAIVPQAPVMASLGPAPDRDRPFYRRLFNATFGGESQ